jgi:acyl-CoA reductase-like NAD-dependent aldehyde dehydrogenase
MNSSLTPGRRRAGGRPGLLLQPTILTGVTKGARILTEEIFGPVAPISTFAADGDAIRLANDNMAWSPTSSAAT